MKNKLLSFIFAFTFILTAGFYLTACGGGGGDNKPQKQAMGIEASLTDTSNDFIATGRKTYDEDFSLSASDFTVAVNYDDGSKENVTNFTLKIYRGSVEVTDFLPGYYTLTFSYNNLSCDLSFNITEIEITESNLTTNLDSSYQYTGAKITPPITISCDGKTLAQDVDYTLYYGDNTNVGQGSVTIEGMGVYEGSVTYYFDITSLSATEPTFNNQTFVYDSTKDYANKQDWVNVSSYTGIESIYYTYDTSEVKNVGTYTVTAQITVSEGYTPIANKTFTITIDPKDIGDINLADYELNNLTVDYKGEEYTADYWEREISSRLERTDLSDLTYTISMSSGDNIDNTNASTNGKTGQFEITASGNYTGTKSVTYTISPLSVERVEINMNNHSSYVYNGNPQTLRTVHYLLEGSYVLLTEGVDYTILYTNNTNASTAENKASYTITGKNNYTGTYNNKFTIEKQTIANQILNWTTSTTEFVYDGEVKDIPATITNVFDTDKVDITYKTFSDINCYNAKEFKDAGTYYVQVKLAVKDPNNYEFWNGDSIWTDHSYTNFVIKPAQATLAYTGPTEFEYTGSVITLNNSDFVVTVGDQTFTQGTDYTLEYPTDNAIQTNVGGYYVTVELASTNYYFYEFSGSYDKSTTKYITINEKQLQESDLTFEYPTITQIVWGYCEIKEGNSGAIKYNGTTIGNFSIGRASSSFDQVLKRNITNDNYTCTFTDIELTDERLSGNFVCENRYFASFKINEIEQTAEQIHNLSTFAIGDKVEITMNEGYMVSHYVSGNSAPFEEKQTTVTFIVGTEKSGENYLFGNETLRIYETGNAEYKVNKTITINKDIFTTFTVGGIDGTSLQNLQYLSSVAVGNAITVNCKEGYEVSIEKVKSGTPTEVVAQAQTAEYTTPSIDEADTIIIKIYKNGSVLLTFNCSVYSN